jgi:hypothetical protein
VSAEFALLVGIARRHRLEIGTGAKIAAAAGEHRDRCGLVGVESEEGIVQLPRGRAIDRILAFGPVDRNDRHRAVMLHKDGIHLAH